MIKLGLCAWMLPMEEEETFAFAGRLGFDGIAIELKYKDGSFHLSDKEKQKKYLELAKENNVVIATFALNTLCDKDHGMSNKEDHETVFDIIDKAVEIAEDMGVKTFQFPSFFASDITNEEEFNNTVTCFKYACEKVKGKDIKIGWENTMDKDNNLLMLERVNSDDFFIYYDTQNPVSFSNLDNVQLAKDLVGSVKEIHAKDSLEDLSAELYIWEGIANFKEVMEVFRDNNYSGWIIIENLYKAFKNYENIIKKDREFIIDLMSGKIK
ncbi:hypothetical protein SH1V18_31680 [Vallitalea longa]|uniref:Xylose isomerase-like TIM barrel domain-containing protein n=1 Tax=Vallitalea longa TaxID=2936439 RepID=A0A9W5YGC6_9FIRM|nr:sugar phosphate isomerase/epimerase family protein [Vallitalea longa]GKX30688.1 hypothetical protein SH1V18_31680 [Vallitalea longa]